MVNSNGKIFLYKFPSPLVPLFLWFGAVLVTECANIWITRGIPQECVVASKNNSFFSPSLITCASQSLAVGASTFGYNNRICDTYEDPNDISLSTMEFGKVTPLDLLEEIASGKEGYASSIMKIYSEERAVDGDTTTNAATRHRSNEFFIFDLGEIRDVHQVRILPFQNFTEGTEIRLGMDRLTTKDLSSYTLFAKYTGEAGYLFDHDSEFLSCYSLGVLGRYISIQRTTSVSISLSIREIEVYASKKP